MPWFDFRWNDWNLGKIAAHGVSPEECEWVVCHSLPRRSGEKYITVGRTRSGRRLKVAYLKHDPITVFVLTAFDV